MAKRLHYVTRTPEADERFFTALRSGASVSIAAGAAGYCRRSCYRWRDADKEFAAAWDDAEADGTDRLEDEAFRRAHDVIEKPVFYRGAACGNVQEYSDALLMFLLRSRRPAKYKDRTTHEHTGKDGAPIEVTVSDRDRAKALAAFMARLKSRE